MQQIQQSASCLPCKRSLQFQEILCDWQNAHSVSSFRVVDRMLAGMLHEFSAPDHRDLHRAEPPERVVPKISLGEK